MADKKITPAGRPTPDQIAEWKGKFKELAELTTEDGKLAIVRVPAIADLETALDHSKRPKARSLDFNRSLYRSCMLYEDDGMMDNDDRKLEILTAMGGISEVKEAKVKKL